MTNQGKVKLAFLRRVSPSHLEGIFQGVAIAIDMLEAGALELVVQSHKYRLEADDPVAIAGPRWRGDIGASRIIVFFPEEPELTRRLGDILELGAVGGNDLDGGVAYATLSKLADASVEEILDRASDENSEAADVDLAAELSDALSTHYGLEANRLLRARLSRLQAMEIAR